MFHVKGLFNRLRDNAQPNEALGKNDASCIVWGRVEVADLAGFDGSDLCVKDNLVYFTLGIREFTRNRP